MNVLLKLWKNKHRWRKLIKSEIITVEWDLDLEGENWVCACGASRSEIDWWSERNFSQW